MTRTPIACALALWLGACGIEAPVESPEAPTAAAPTAAAPSPDGDIGGGPAPPTSEGTAPLTVALPTELFDAAQVRCAGGFQADATPEPAGARSVVLVPGLPLGESCVLLLKGRIVSRHGPVTAGQRWTCKFRRAEARCKLLGGPPEPTLPSPEGWVWDKVEAVPTTKSEARALDAAQAEGAPPDE